MLLNLSKEINLKLYTHDGKYFHHEMLRVSGESIDIEFDTLLAGYLLNPEAKNYDLQKLIALYCNVNIDYENMDSRKRIEIFSELCNIMNCLIKESNQESLLRQIEIPFSLVLADMEDQGFELDQAGLIKFGGNLQLLIEVLKNEICFMAGCEFNINSSQQMAKILFDNLGLPCGKKTKTGYSTNVEVLEFLKEKHPIITKILEYRQFTKLNSTYVDGMLKEVRSDNRIHSIFNQTETRTGRISSEKPNMQNIPIRTELGSELRKFFKASPGHELIDADYSQIELRVLAHMSGDEKMINVFKSDKDIHTKTASEVFNVDICDVTQKMRSFSKAVNFGIIYGISGFSLSKDIGVSVAQATEYINNYFSKFKGVKKYLDQLINDAVNNGYVTTLFGRKRIIPELKSNNKNIRLSGERIARNTPIQGTAADIIKIAMIKVYNRLKSEGLKSRIILQVHDELIIEAPVEEIQRAKEILYTEMERAADLAVPLKVDIGVGENWFLSHR
jgi:DNA polymerase-1